jgi:hypothetical protein
VSATQATAGYRYLDSIGQLFEQPSPLDRSTRAAHNANGSMHASSFNVGLPTRGVTG